MQPKLLRAIQEKKIIRVGDNKVTHVDVRIISATNKNLNELVRTQRFREDLYYRLNVLYIYIPALAERKEDIPLLIRHYLTANDSQVTLSPGALELLSGSRWPGNVRQLFNVMERITVLHRSSVVTKQDVEDLLFDVLEPARPMEYSAPTARPNHTLSREQIEQALQKHQYNKGLAARQLGVSRSTLWRKMKELGWNE